MENRILVLGGGFGGVRTALDLSRKFQGRGDVKIMLLDRNESQTFQPTLYEVASIYGINHEHPYHTKLRGTICIPYREIFEGRGVELIQAEINHIDLDARHAVTNNGATISFDFLVIALGSTVSTFDIPGVMEYAFKFKTIEDGLMVNDKVEELYTEAGKNSRPLPINILIGGAGFNGVELAAELANCTVHIAHRHNVTQQNCTSITLIEGGPTILPMISEGERESVLRRLKELGVNIMLNSPIEEVGPDYMKFKGGSTMKGDLIVWSGGVKALDIFKKVVGLELDDRNRIMVNEFLQVKKYSNVFAIGDNIIFNDPATTKPIPQMAFLAIEQGKIAAENIYKIITKNLELKKHEPSYDFWIAPVGGKYAIAHLGQGGVSGFVGYLIREIVDFRYYLSILPFLKALKIFFSTINAFIKND